MQSHETSSYDRNFQERSKTLAGLNPAKMYYDLTEQNKFRMALETLNDFVVGDIMEDLRTFNYFNDHLSAIKIHFLLTHYVFAYLLMPSIK